MKNSDRRKNLRKLELKIIQEHQKFVEAYLQKIKPKKIDEPSYDFDFLIKEQRVQQNAKENAQAIQKWKKDFKKHLQNQPNYQNQDMGKRFEPILIELINLGSQLIKNISELATHFVGSTHSLQVETDEQLWQQNNKLLHNNLENIKNQFLLSKEKILNVLESIAEQYESQISKEKVKFNDFRAKIENHQSNQPIFGKRENDWQIAEKLNVVREIFEQLPIRYEPNNNKFIYKEKPIKKQSSINNAKEKNRQTYKEIEILNSEIIMGKKIKPDQQPNRKKDDNKTIPNYYSRDPQQSSPIRKKQRQRNQHYNRSYNLGNDNFYS